MPTLTDENEDQEIDTGQIQNPGNIWNEYLNKNPQSGRSRDGSSEESNATFEGIVGASLQDMEEAGNKIINDNADSDDDEDDTENRRKQIQDEEEDADEEYQNNVGKQQAKQRADLASQTLDFLSSGKTPLGVTTILVGGTLTIATVVGGPASIFAAVISQLTNETNYSAAATHVRGLKMLSHRIGGSKDDAKVKAACENPKSIMCKSSTMSEKQILDLKDADINVISNGKDIAEELERAEKDPSQPIDDKIKIDDRFTAEEIKVPTGDLDKDGKMLKQGIKAGDDIELVLKNNPKLRTNLFKGYNPLTKVFFSSHFNAVLRDSFKTHRGDKLTGDDEKTERQSMRESLGISGVEGDENGRMTDAEREQVSRSKAAEVRAKVGKANQKLTGPAGQLCTGVNTAQLMTAAAKAQRMLELARIFVVYASEVHRIMDGTSAPQHATFIGDNLTYGEYNPFDSSGKKNRFFKTSATDAEGMHMLLHNSQLELSDWARKYMVGGNGAIREIDKLLQDLYKNTPGGKPTVKTVCRYASSLASCLGPRAGACALMYVAFAAAAPLIGKAVEPLMEEAIAALADLQIDDATHGIDLGNPLAFGAEVAGGRMGQEVGLRPSGVATQKNYRKITAETNEQIAMMYREEAKATPFDVTNQYSFMGTIAKNIYSQGGIASSVFGNISRMAAVIPASIDVVSKGTVAGASGMTMEQNDFLEENMQKCDDPALKSIGIDGKPGCTPAFDMSENALNMDIEANQNFMIKGGYADEETGQPKAKPLEENTGIAGTIDTATAGLPSATKGSKDGDRAYKFAMYKKYCPNRDQEKQGPYGTTVESIETGSDADERWRVGDFCVNAVDDPKPAVSAVQSGDSTNAVYAYESDTSTANKSQLAATVGDDGPTRAELDNFAAFTMDYGDAGSSTMMDEGNKPAQQQVSGDCSQLAQQLLDNKDNVNFQLEEQRTYMEQTARDCTQTLDCGGSVQMSTKLLQLLVKASQNYKITIGAQAAGHQCDPGYHPKGQAVDINGVRKPDQQMQRMTTWDSTDQPIFKEFYEFLEQNSDVPLELGQRTCFSGATPALSKSELVNDSCNHVHVAVTEH